MKIFGTETSTFELGVTVDKSKATEDNHGQLTVCINGEQIVV